MFGRLGRNSLKDSMAASAIADWVLLVGLVIKMVQDLFVHLFSFPALGVPLALLRFLRSAQIDAADVLAIRCERLRQHHYLVLKRTIFALSTI